MGAVVRGSSCRGRSCPWEQLSVGAVVVGAVVRGSSCRGRSCPWEQLSWAQLSWAHTSWDTLKSNLTNVVT